MNFHTSTAKVLVGVAFITLLAGCGPSKQSQCQTLNEKMGKSKELVKKFEDEGKNIEAAFGKSKNFDDFKGASQKAATIVKDLDSEVGSLNDTIKGVELKDEKLVELRQRYSGHLADLSAAFKEMVTTLDKIQGIEQTPKGIEELKTIVADLEGVSKKLNDESKDEDKTLADFKSYCELK